MIHTQGDYRYALPLPPSSYYPLLKQKETKRKHTHTHSRREKQRAMIFEAPNAAHATPNWIFPDAALVSIRERGGEERL